MGSELLARVRWNNVGIVALAAALLVLVVAWPALSPAPPALPADDPPVTATTSRPPAAATPAPAPTAAPARHGVVQRHASRPKRHERRHQRARQAAPRPAAPPPVTVQPTPPLRYSAPAPPPAPEFAFER
jgi:hypothetical protein